MSTTTANLGLFKYDTTTDGASPFNINTALNNNWDIIDTAVGTGGSPTTVVDGTTWYRRWSDGWKEQGGEVSLSETEFDFVTPTLSSNGTMGGSTFAVQAIAERDNSDTYRAYRMFDGNTSTSWCAYASAFTGAVWFTFYNPIPLKVSTILCHGYVNGTSGYNIKSGTVYGGNDNSTWDTVCTYSNLSGANALITVNSTKYYNYYKVYIAGNQGSNQVWIDEVTITATYLAEVANSITFPVAFSNTNYSYTFANQDGGGMDAYVSNKTTTGMTLSNTNSGSASWTACGY